ncbi:MAG TPA: hypothetical protein VFG07_10450 [Thermoplasmata archaeon]|nr:hypothetical protein [Thermoplasmata archaeon]
MADGRRSRKESPRVFRSLQQEALHRRDSPTGTVGRLFRGSGMELVWVRKQGEEVDPHWFSSRAVDILIVVQGRLRVDFSDHRFPSRTLAPGDVLVLPPRTSCRGYRWPRASRRATVFLAVYPSRGRRRGR